MGCLILIALGVIILILLGPAILVTGWILSIFEALGRFLVWFYDHLALPLSVGFFVICGIVYILGRTGNRRR